MSSDMNAKVRHVRCPRCLILLPEPADIPVYKCGGCDQILKAKVRKEDTQEAGASVHEADPTKENDLGNFSEDDKATTLSIYESYLDKISEKGEDGTGCNVELLLVRNQSNPSCSDGISCYENTSLSADATQLMEAEEAEIPSEQCCTEECNESTNDGAEHFRNISVSSEIPLSSESNHHENESSVPRSQVLDNEVGASSARKVAESPYTSENNTRGDANVSEICDMELHLESSYWMENSSADLCTSYEVEDPSQPAGVDTEVDENVKKHSSTETSLEIMQNDQNDQSSSSVSADYLTCPCTEPEKQAQNGAASDFQRVSSADTLEVIPRFYSKNDLGVTLKSPTAKRYYSYDVGASSCHETDDKVPRRRFQPLKRNSKDASYRSDKPGSKRDDEFMVNEVTSSASKMQHRPTNFSSSSPGKKFPDSKWHQNAFREPARYRHPVRSIMSSSVNYREKKLFEMHNNPLEADKLELLRMVYELQDQLSKAQTLKGIPHRRLSAGVAEQEEQFSSYNDHFAVQREDPDANYQMYPGRYGQDVTWLQQGNQISHMAPMSGHTALTSSSVNCLCLRCRRQERYYSAQLPRHVIGSNKGQYNRPYRSASGPQHYYTPSEFSLRSHYTKSDDQKHNHHALKKKLTIVKQHSLPIAGGSPILACYRCFEMLHMPADFLLFNKRCHRLKCSACGEVLMFSLQKKRPSTASHADDCPHSEPVSFSDDYGKSFCRSCSTERNQFPLVPPFNTATGVFGRTKMTSSNSLKSKNERMKSIVVDEFPDKQKNRGKTFDAERPSSEIEELPPSSAGSQLHQLMGYPSPSRLIYKYSYSDYSTVESD